MFLGFNGWFELMSEYVDIRPGPLKPGEDAAGVVGPAPNGSTWLSRRASVNPQRSLLCGPWNVY